MIRKLRIKLVAVSMLSLFLVLFLIMGTVNLVNYLDILREADETLALLAENQGRFPKPEDDFHRGDGRFPRDQSPELPYESRFFSVLLEPPEKVVTVDTGRIAAIDSDMAIAFAREVTQSGKTSGFHRAYRFLCVQEGELQRVIFLDCTRGLSTFRTFLLGSCAISACGLLAVFLLMLLLSRRIVKPFSENYEKQKQFITDAGHELKTPISIIDADTEVLAMELGENEWLQDIHKQSSRLASLTSELIYLSRMEEAHCLQMLDFPFSDLVEETAQSFLAPAKTQSKTLDIQVEPMISLCGDEKALAQLVTLLLDNALKYAPESGWVKLNLSKTGKSVRLTVENTAQDVQEDQLPHFFDRFYRGDKARSSQTGGYGIGLSIAKAIVQAHKGKITASTRDGASILITVTLPC